MKEANKKSEKLSPETRNLPNGYVTATELNTGFKSRSRLLMVDGSGQGASWQMCV